MGIIEAIKRGFAIATKSLGLVFVLFAFNLIWNLASIPLAQAGAAATPQLTTSAIILSVAFILASIFVQGGALGMVRDSIQEGKMKIGNFFSYGLKYYIRLLTLGLIIVLIIGIVGLLAALLVALTAPLNNPVVTIIAAVIAIAIGAIGLYFVLLLVMSPYVLVCEETGAIQSMKRSMTVVKKAIGRVLLLLVLLILISLGVGFLIGFLTGLITAPMSVSNGQIVIGVVNSAFNGYLGIVMMASFTLFYLALGGKQKA